MNHMAGLMHVDMNRTDGCSDGDGQIHSPWILRYTIVVPDTRVLMVTKGSDGIECTTQLRWLPVLWVRVIPLYVYTSQLTPETNKLSYQCLGSHTIAISIETI